MGSGICNPLVVNRQNQEPIGKTHSEGIDSILTAKAEEGLPTSDFRLPTSEFRLPTSDFQIVSEPGVIKNKAYLLIHLAITYVIDLLKTQVR